MQFLIFLLHTFQLFKEDPSTGITHVALSSDSTCVHNLYSAQDGYETLHLEKDNDEEDEITALSLTSGSSSSSLTGSGASCLFPDWMQGKWEGLGIEGGEMVFRDAANFATYRGKCVESGAADRPDRFVVELKTDCGRKSNYCALFQQRDVNVLEFQLGKHLEDFFFGPRIPVKLIRRKECRHLEICRCVGSDSENKLTSYSRLFQPPRRNRLFILK